MRSLAENEVSLNVHDHGIFIDELKRRAKCNYCGKVVSGFSRLKCHLGGVRGDVAPCEEVPEAVKELIRSNLLEKKKGNLSKEVGKLLHPDLPWKRNWCHQSENVQHHEPDGGSGSKKRLKKDYLSENSVIKSVCFPKSGVSSQVAICSIEDSSVQQIQKCIGRFFYETGLDFSAAKSPSFLKMINATLGSCHSEYKVPSCQDLKGWILRDELKEMQQYVREIRSSWVSTGCSILLDGWINGEGKTIINILVDCPRGVIYLRSNDISAFDEDVNAMQLFFDAVLKEVGVENVVQIITYSTSAWMEALGKELMDKHRTFFWTVSASHCIALMLEKIGVMDVNQCILVKAKTITKLIHSHAALLKMFRYHTNGRDLVKPSKIRSAMPFLTLENIVSEEKLLRKMFTSSEWKASYWASKEEGKRVAELVADNSFWNGANMVLKATIPLVRVLDLLFEGDRQQLGYIYETIDQAKETIKEEFRNKKSQYLPFWTEIDEIWNKYLYNPLHAAGYVLNPILFYAEDFYTDAEVASGLLCCFVRTAEDKHVQDLLLIQFEEYRNAKGAFGQGSAIDQRTNITPVQWWQKYGSQCPELQNLAIRILSQTCDGASKFLLKRDLAEKLLMKGRSNIEQQRLDDLVFVHHNLQLRNFDSRVNKGILDDEIDPMNDWIVDERPEVVCLEDEITWVGL